MFTLFWAGNTFAPQLNYRNEPIQDFLQKCFVNAYAYLAKRLLRSKVETVLGFEVINEPHAGYIGLENIVNHFDQNSNLNLGASPSALQSFAAGNGMTQDVDYWVKTCMFAIEYDYIRAPTNTPIWKNNNQSR